MITNSSARRCVFRSLAAFAVVGSSLTFGASAAAATSSLVTSESILQGTTLEVGIAANASAGTDGGAPTGFYPRSNSSSLGFVVDRDRWGVGTDDGGFVVPGNPYEGWGMQSSTASLFNDDAGDSNKIDNYGDNTGPSSNDAPESLAFTDDSSSVLTLIGFLMLVLGLSLIGSTYRSSVNPEAW